MSGKKDKKKESSDIASDDSARADEASIQVHEETIHVHEASIHVHEASIQVHEVSDQVHEVSDQVHEASDDSDEAGGPPTRRMLDEEQPLHGFETEPHIKVVPSVLDPELTLDLTGDALDAILRDDSKAASPLSRTIEAPTAIPQGTLGRDHLKGLLEALIFASDKPLRAAELARSAAAPLKEVNLLLAVLKAEYASRGVQLDEVAGGWIFRTHVAFAPFVRDMAKQKPVRLTRAQVETLAILAYRQPITRPEIDDIRGVDCGPVLKVLLERDLVKILGKKDEPGRPILYGTTSQFLEFFGLKSLKDLPTLREFTELNEDSRRTVEKELGDVLEAAQPEEADAAPVAGESEVAVDDVPTDVHSPHAHAPPPSSSESLIDPPDDTVTALDDDPPSDIPET